MTRPFKVEGYGGSCGGGRRRAPAGPALYEGDYDLGLAAFCRGAGVDPRSITSEARSVALQLAGQLLRESVLGLMDLNQGRNEFRNRFRMAPPPNDGPESPLNLSQGVDEALVRLLTTVSTRLGSVEAIRENFRELKAHNAAVAGVPSRAAFEEFLGPRGPEGAGGALRPRHQARRVRDAEQGEILGSVCRNVRGTWRSGRRTGFRTCSPKPLPKPTKPNCAHWLRRGAPRSAPIEARRAIPMAARSARL